MLVFDGIEDPWNRKQVYPEALRKLDKVLRTVDMNKLEKLEEKVDMIMEHLGLELVDVPASKSLQKKKG